VLLVETGRRQEGDLAAGAVLYPKSSAERRLYLFTSKASMDKFEADPEGYLARLARMNVQGPPPAVSPAQQPTEGSEPRPNPPSVFGVRRPN
jgi:hypothetical protein